MVTERVIAYVDGFNLYYGIREAFGRRYLWLDVQALARKLLKPAQRLVLTKYFTSRVSATVQDPDKPKRQRTYVEALGTLPDLRTFYGHYLDLAVQCFKCQHTWPSHEEKMTDVNIAVELMGDAFDNAFDMALVVSGDSDLSHMVEVVRARFPGKRVVVAFPPKRHSSQLEQVASASLTIGRGRLEQSQFPEEVMKAGGYVLRRPPTWT